MSVSCEKDIMSVSVIRACAVSVQKSCCDKDFLFDVVVVLFLSMPTCLIPSLSACLSVGLSACVSVLCVCRSFSCKLCFFPFLPINSFIYRARRIYRKTRSFILWPITLRQLCSMVTIITTLLYGQWLSNSFVLFKGKWLLASFALWSMIVQFKFKS